MIESPRKAANRTSSELNVGRSRTCGPPWMKIKTGVLRSTFEGLTMYPEISLPSNDFQRMVSGDLTFPPSTSGILDSVQLVVFFDRISNDLMSAGRAMFSMVKT